MNDWADKPDPATNKINRNLLNYIQPQPFIKLIVIIT